MSDILAELNSTKETKELLIEGGGNSYAFPVVDGITLQTTRRGAPAKLTCTILRSDGTNTYFTPMEGAKVQLKVDGENVFMGYIFSRTQDKSDKIQIVAYDQLRYLKAKDTYLYTNKTATEVIQMIAKDMGLTTGEIADTSFKIDRRVEEGQTLFDIILNALDLTFQSTKELYCLYDDFGKITLKNLKDMTVGGTIGRDSAENFTYTTSIDQDTYNKVRVMVPDDKKGTATMYNAQDGGNQSKWGVLQYYFKAQKGANGQNLANTILKAKNRKTTLLKMRNVIGEGLYNLRAGCSVQIMLELDTLIVYEQLLCENVTLHFYADYTTADIDFYGTGGE